MLYAAWTTSQKEKQRKEDRGEKGRGRKGKGEREAAFLNEKTRKWIWPWNSKYSKRPAN